MDLGAWLQRAEDGIRAWEARWGAVDVHSALKVDESDLHRSYDRYVNRLSGNYPFFHPCYAGQMLKPPHPVAILGYLTAMRINPNNHALDGGPPTAAMEKECVRALAEMFDFPANSLGHLTTSGTIANLEALFIARELSPDGTVVVCEEGHYTHARMGHVLGVPVQKIRADARGRMDLEDLARVLRSGGVSTVVLTAGSTALGAVDPIADATLLCREYGARVHVDAAYGGFFRIIKDTGVLEPEASRNMDAIRQADSVVVDPHKHGLQPYGCGAVLFSDPSVGRFYMHDSPYTYFSSDDLHLGEVSLECSRAGAAAGAFWLTLELLPLEEERGFGPILADCVYAARRFEAALEHATPLRTWGQGDLDIAAYYADGASTSVVDAKSVEVFNRAMDIPLYLSLLRVSASQLGARRPEMIVDSEHVRILRSVLMKPEQADWSEHLTSQLSELVQ